MPTDLDQLAEDAASEMFPHDPAKVFATWSEVFKPMDLLTDPRWLGPLLRRLREFSPVDYTDCLMALWQHAGGKEDGDLFIVATHLVAAHKAKTTEGE